MNPIVDLKTLPQRLRSLGKRVIVAVASPADAHTEEVIERSVSEGFADFNNSQHAIHNKSRSSKPPTTTTQHAKPCSKCAKHAPTCS